MAPPNIPEERKKRNKYVLIALAVFGIAKVSNWALKNYK